MDLIKNSFLEAQQVLEAFISDEKNLGQVKNAGDLLVDMFRQGGKVFSCGNGGSLWPLQLPILPISPVYRTI